MRRVIFSILICCLLSGFWSIRAQADEQSKQAVTEIDVNGLKFPVVGNSYVSQVSVKTSPDVQCSLKVIWYRCEGNVGTQMCNGETFAAGVPYRCRISIKLKEDGAVFPASKKEILDDVYYGYDGVFKINGKAYTNARSNAEGSSLTIIVSFDAAKEAACTHEASSEVLVRKGSFTKSGRVDNICNYCSEITGSRWYGSINHTELSTSTVSYNGKVRKPYVCVQDEWWEDLPSDCYALTVPEGRKDVGTYEYIITLTSPYYKGTKSLYFTINPKGTSISTLTPVSKGFKVYWTAVTDQVDGYEIQFSTSSYYITSKTVTITSNTKAARKITGRAAKKVYYVRIRTYKDSNGVRYYSGWSKSQTVTTKP